MLHLIPVDEFDLHARSPNCECDPDIQWVHPHTGQILDEPLVIHPPFAALPIVLEAEQILSTASKS
jgi:hypothetical protein